MILSADLIRQLRNASLSALYRVAYDHDVDLSDVMASFTPSQPSSASQAPAARMPEEATSDVQAEAAPQTSADPHAAASATVDAQADAAGTELTEPAAPNSEAEHIPAFLQPQPTSTPAVQARDGGADGLPASPVVSTSQPGAEGAESPAPTRGRPATIRAKIVACHEEHPTWPSKLIAKHLGITEDAVRAAASRKKLKLVSWWDYQRTLSPEQRTVQAKPTPAAPTKRDLVREAHAAHPDFTAKELAFHLGIDELNLRAVASQIGLKLPKASTVADRAKSAPAKPQEPAERAGPPTPRAEPKQPPVSTADEPFDDDEPEPRVRKVNRAPTGRFYLRDRGGLYVHQSLQPSVLSTGPMMTSDRKWAWFDTMERYKGAKKLWPELAEMRKEAVQA